MGKRIALNVLYNVGIMLCLFTGYWGIENKQYAYVLGAAFIAAICIVFKVRLLREIKAMNKKP